MAHFENESRELNLKLVYYGPPLSGKTTNLQTLHRFLKANARGRLMKLDAADDRTLFCDFLPVFWSSSTGMKIKLNVYTVPGQFMHRTTRKLLLAGTDGVIFVAAAQVEEAHGNENAWRSMKNKLLANSLDPDTLPIVVQFNKKDLPEARDSADLASLQEGRTEPIYAASALQGIGVLEPFFACMRLIFRAACSHHDLESRFGLHEASLLRELANQLELGAVGANLEEVIRAFGQTPDGSNLAQQSNNPQSHSRIDGLFGDKKDAGR